MPASFKAPECREGGGTALSNCNCNFLDAVFFAASLIFWNTHTDEYLWDFDARLAACAQLAALEDARADAGDASYEAGQEEEELEEKLRNVELLRAGERDGDGEGGGGEQEEDSVPGHTFLDRLRCLQDTSHGPWVMGCEVRVDFKSRRESPGDWWRREQEDAWHVDQFDLMLSGEKKKCWFCLGHAERRVPAAATAEEEASGGVGGPVEGALEKCGKCRIAHYCSQAGCQKAHWPEHKHECKILRECRKAGTKVPCCDACFRIDISRLRVIHY